MAAQERALVERHLENARIRDGIVFSTAILGDVLVCGLSSGHVMAWDLEVCAARRRHRRGPSVVSRFSVGSAVYCVAVLDERLLACGCDRFVVLYSWAAIAELAKKASGAVRAPPIVAKFEAPRHALPSGAILAAAEANALAWDAESKRLWIGCGDGVAYGWDVERADPSTAGDRAANGAATSVRAHDDMILALEWADAARVVVTGSEDGTVALYDARASSSSVSRRLDAAAAVTSAGSRGFCAGLCVDADATWVTCVGGLEPAPGAVPRAAAHGGWVASFHGASGSLSTAARADAACRCVAADASRLYVGGDAGLAVWGRYAEAAKPIRTIETSLASVYAVDVVDPAPPALLSPGDLDEDDDDDRPLSNIDNAAGDLGPLAAIVLAGAEPPLIDVCCVPDRRVYSLDIPIATTTNNAAVDNMVIITS